MELDHTADWSLRVWAPDLPGLFEQAARGMYALMEMPLEAAPRSSRSLSLIADDKETLLVSFLSELLYLSEKDGLMFDRYDIHISEDRLEATVDGMPYSSQRKEIKAVTYHNLAVRRTEHGYEVTIVFDV